MFHEGCKPMMAWRVRAAEARLLHNQHERNSDQTPITPETPGDPSDQSWEQLLGRVSEIFQGSDAADRDTLQRALTAREARYVAEVFNKSEEQMVQALENAGTGVNSEFVLAITQVLGVLENGDLLNEEITAERDPFLWTLLDKLQPDRQQSFLRHFNQLLGRFGFRIYKARNGRFYYGRRGPRDGSQAAPGATDSELDRLLDLNLPPGLEAAEPLVKDIFKTLMEIMRHLRELQLSRGGTQHFYDANLGRWRRRGGVFGRLRQRHQGLRNNLVQTRQQQALALQQWCQACSCGQGIRATVRGDTLLFRGDRDQIRALAARAQAGGQQFAAYPSQGTMAVGLLRNQVGTPQQFFGNVPQQSVFTQNLSVQERPTAGQRLNQLTNQRAGIVERMEDTQRTIECLYEDMDTTPPQGIQNGLPYPPIAPGLGFVPPHLRPPQTSPQQLRQEYERQTKQYQALQKQLREVDARIQQVNQLPPGQFLTAQQTADLPPQL